MSGKNIVYRKEVVGKRQMQRRIAREVETTIENLSKVESDSNFIEATDVTETKVNTDTSVSQGCSNSESFNMPNELSTAASTAGPSFLNLLTAEVPISPIPFEEKAVEDDSADSEIEENDIKIKLRDWALRNKKVPLSAISDLLHVLSPFHPELPLDARTLLGTPVNVSSNSFKLLDNGEYVHLGLFKNIQRILLCTSFQSDLIQLSFNVDGLPLFNNSTKQIWPILGLIVNSSYTTPFAIGIFYGKSKPKPLDLYLEDFINELSELISCGVVFNGRKYKIVINSFICDAPAKAFIKCIKLHSGYSSCDKCTDTGDYVNGRIIFKSVSAPKRSDQHFRTQIDDDHHCGTSPLLKLNFDMVKCFPIDYMHCICLGVMKKLLMSWITGNIYNVRLSNKKVTDISSHLGSLCPHFTSDFNRKLESLSDIAHWKATQFRTFLLYVGPLVLKNAIDKSVYEHFLLLHCGVTILLSERHLQKCGYDLADTLLKNFVTHCRKIYGLEYLIYNVHILTHIADDAKEFGVLDNISAFPFENYLGKLKSLVRSPKSPLQQLFRRLQELDCLSPSKNINCNVSFHLEHNGGPLLCQINNCKQYKKIVFNNTLLSTKSHSPANSYCITSNNVVLQIENIIHDFDHKEFLVAREYIEYESLYSYPFESTLLQISVVHRLSDLKMYPLNDIVTKCMLFPFCRDSVNRFVCFPLLHNLNA